jgi:hypothetical protein
MAYTVCCAQAKERRAFNAKRILSIGGSVVAIIVLILLMTGLTSTGKTPKRADLQGTL